MKGLIIVVILGLLPALLSFMVVRRAKQQFRVRMQRIRTMTFHHQRHSTHFSSLNRELQPEYQDWIGNITCYFNARSPFLRCAVNPSGPCENCSFYRAKE